VYASLGVRTRLKTEFGANNEAIGWSDSYTSRLGAMIRVLPDVAKHGLLIDPPGPPCEMFKCRRRLESETMSEVDSGLCESSGGSVEIDSPLDQRYFVH